MATRKNANLVSIDEFGKADCTFIAAEMVAKAATMSVNIFLSDVYYAST
jgi:hypothetical protein